MPLAASQTPTEAPWSLAALLDTLRNRLFTAALWFAMAMAAWGLAIAPFNAYNDHQGRSVALGAAQLAVWIGVLGWRARVRKALMRHPELLVAGALVLGVAVLWTDGGWRSSFYLASYSPVFLACTVADRSWAWTCAATLAVGYVGGLAVHDYTVARLQELKDLDSVVANTGGYLIAAGALLVVIDRLTTFVTQARRHATPPATLAAPPVAAVSEGTGASPAPPANGPRLRLTPRQLDVAALIARGLSNRQIASELYIQPKSVENLVRAMLRRAGASDRRELLDRLIEERLVDPPAPE